MRKLPNPVRKFCQPNTTMQTPTTQHHGAVEHLEEAAGGAGHLLGDGGQEQVIVAPRRDGAADEDAVDEECRGHFLQPQQRVAGFARDHVDQGGRR